MRSLTVKMEKLFFWLLVINPFIDVLGGVWIYAEMRQIDQDNLFFSMITPSLILRMLVLLLFAAYVLLKRDRQIIAVILPMGIAWLFTVAGEFLFPVSEDFSFFLDAQYMAKFIYNIAVLLVYWRVFAASGLTREQLLEKLNRVCSFTLTLFSTIIILSNIFSTGFNTYADRWGYRGSRGFFYSGNDITAILLLLLPLAIAYYLQSPGGLRRRERLFRLYAPAATLACLLVIGTKTSFLALLLPLGAFYVYSFRQRRQTPGLPLVKRMNRLTLAFLLIFVLMILLSQGAAFFGLALSIGTLKDIMDDMGLGGMLLSGRGAKLAWAFEQYVAGGPYNWLFGIGRGTQLQIVEMDVFECWLFYGIVGAVVMLWLYLRTGLDFISRFRRRVDLTGLACFISLGMCAGYSIIAGHIIFSVTSGFYFSLIMLYAQLHYAANVQALQLLDWPKWLARLAPCSGRQA